MTDIGDDLLDGDLEDTTFGELDAEEEDALLADDDFEANESSRQNVYNASQQESEEYQIVDQWQDVSDGDEIIEDGEEDVLELAVLDELDESELDNSQETNQMWPESTSSAVEEDSIMIESTVGESRAVGGESDEEESDGRGSRFRTERTTVISLKGVLGGNTLKDIPDSLDNVKTSVAQEVRPRGGMQHTDRGNVRGRLGPIQPRVMARRGFGPMRRGSNMIRMPYHHQQPNHANKIHVNPHFRASGNPSPNTWDRERLPPPPGCESYMLQERPHMDWGGPPPQNMDMRPPYSPQQPGPPHFQSPPQPQQMFPPQQQVYEEQLQRPMMQQPQPNHSRRVQFSENAQLVTVENQHFQKPSFDQTFGPGNNHFQPPPPTVHPNFNNNAFPNQYGQMPRQNFQPQPFPPNNPPQNFGGYPPQEFHQLQNNVAFQNYDNQNNWNASPHMMGPQPGQMHHSSHPIPTQQPSAFSHPQPDSSQFRPSFSPNRPQLATQRNQLEGRIGTVMKRTLPRPAPSTLTLSAKQMRFDHNKHKSVTRGNLQEIKTVDNLPDTTTTQEPEPEIEEDEETKQYRKKIAEQKALREKILKEKEARRLASIKEKQKLQESQINLGVKSTNAPQPVPQQCKLIPPQPRYPGPSQLRQPGPQQFRQLAPSQFRQPTPSQFRQPAPSQFRQPAPSQFRQPAPSQPSLPLVPARPRPVASQRGRPGLRTIPVSKSVATLQRPITGSPVVQIQQMLGTMYKIVKVRTKEGAIVTRKTPLMLTQASAEPQRRIVLNASAQPTARMTNNVGRGGGVNTNIRMVSATNVRGRTLFRVQTTPPENMPKAQPPQRVVIDKKPLNMNVATMPELPVSTLVTVDNLSLSTSQAQLQKLAKQVGTLTSIKHDPDLKRATLKFQQPKDAQQFFHKFHRKMIDLSRIVVTVVPE